MPKFKFAKSHSFKPPTGGKVIPAQVGETHTVGDNQAAVFSDLELGEIVSDDAVETDPEAEAEAREAQKAADDEAKKATKADEKARKAADKAEAKKRKAAEGKGGKGVLAKAAALVGGKTEGAPTTEGDEPASGDTPTGDLFE